MGNFTSCTPSAHGKLSRSAEVIFPSGEFRQFHAPVYAAELMLDMPNHFLVSARSMDVGKRFSPLSADEVLETGAVYAMFPMKRVNSVVTAADVGAPWMAAGSEVGRGPGGSIRLRPESPQRWPEPCEPVGIQREREAPRLSLEDASTCEPMPRLSACRSRKPSLGTINEETVYLR